MPYHTHRDRKEVFLNNDKKQTNKNKTLYDIRLTFGHSFSVINN